MIKKLLARFGKGAATVDLRFDNSQSYYAGDVIEGKVHIQGGKVEQKVNSLSARLILSVQTQKGETTKEAAKIPLSGAFIIRPKEEKVIPFTYQLPANLPVSRGSLSYYFDTLLEIDGGAARKDVDYFTIDVPKKMQPIFRALSSLGFREKHTSGRLDQYGQVFSFFPTEALAERIQEADLRLAAEENGVRLWMEVTGKGGQPMKAKQELFFERTDLENETDVAKKLKDAMMEAVDHPQAHAESFSYMNPGPATGQQGGSGIAGMVGGMAMGILGGMLLGELMESFIGEDEDLFAGGAEELEFAEDELDFEDDDFGDESADDGGGFDFGDFFDGGGDF